MKYFIYAIAIVLLLLFAPFAFAWTTDIIQLSQTEDSLTITTIYQERYQGSTTITASVAENPCNKCIKRAMEEDIDVIDCSSDCSNKLEY